MRLAELATQFIAFDRNPERVALGQEKRVRVVYGDGASPVLLKVPLTLTLTLALTLSLKPNPNPNPSPHPKLTLTRSPCSTQSRWATRSAIPSSTPRRVTLALTLTLTLTLSLPSNQGTCCSRSAGCRRRNA